jgi:hypothetical protein
MVSSGSVEEEASKGDRTGQDQGQPQARGQEGKHQANCPPARS